MTPRITRTANVRRFVCEIASLARRNGFDLNGPLNTVDGDEVSIYSIDRGHPFPIVGEVFDFNANVSWLARWDSNGVYKGSAEAVKKHSLERNTGLAASIGVSLPGGPPLRTSSLATLERLLATPPHLGPFIFEPGRQAGKTLLNEKFERGLSKGFDFKTTQPNAVTNAKDPNIAARLQHALHVGRLVANAATEAFTSGETTPHAAVTVTMGIAEMVKAGRLKIAPDVEKLPFEMFKKTLAVLRQDPDAEAKIERVALSEIDNPEVARRLRFGKFDAVSATEALYPDRVFHGATKNADTLGPTPVNVKTPGAVARPDVHPDTVRLNWLENNRALVNQPDTLGGKAHVNAWDRHYYGANYRDVIDHARNCESAKAAQ